MSEILKYVLIPLFPPSFPSYYVNGRDTSLEDFLDPEILDTLAVKTNEVLEVTAGSFNSASVFDTCDVKKGAHAFCPGSESKTGFSWEAGVAGRDKLSLRRRSRRTVGYIRSRIHVSLYAGGQA